METIYAEVRDTIIQQIEEEMSRIDTISNYKFLKLIGKGGQSKVYLVQNLKTKEIKAIKSFRKDILLDNLDGLKI